MSTIGYEATLRHVQYHASHVKEFFPGKSLAKIAGALNMANQYCCNVLPGLIVDRADYMVKSGDEPDYT